MENLEIRSQSTLLGVSFGGKSCALVGRAYFEDGVARRIAYVEFTNPGNGRRTHAVIPLKLKVLGPMQEMLDPISREELLRAAKEYLPHILPKFNH